MKFVSQLLDYFRRNPMTDQATDTLPAATTETVQEASETAAPTPPVADTANATTVSQTAPAIDEIHQKLIAAKAAHAANLQAVQDSQTALAALRAEFSSAVSWFAQEKDQLEAGIDDMATAADSWFTKLVKEI